MSEMVSGADRPEFRTQFDGRATGVDCSAAGKPPLPEDADAEVERWAAKLHLRVADVEVFLRNKFSFEMIPEQNSAHRRNLLSYLRKKGEHPSRWLLISGLFPEIWFEEGDRRKRIRALHKATVLLIRRSLARAAVDPCKGERTVFWDPIAEVCRELQIAPSKLSALMKEFSGNSLSQVVDCVRVERVKGKMKAGVKRFLVSGSEFLVEGGERQVSGSGFLVSGSQKEARSACLGTEKVDRWAVWEGLKKSRRWPEYSQNTWAMELGFGSYRRLYRACLAVFGQTPHQMEMGMIQECLEAGEREESDEGVVDWAGVLLEAEEAVKGVKEYFDDGG